MRKNAILILVILCGSIVWYLYPSEYEAQMKMALDLKAKNIELLEFDGQREPAFPVEDDGTILGVDTNNNGIRDDIDIWINRIGVDYNERMAMRQFAKTQSDLLDACEKKHNESISQLMTSEFESQLCLGAASDFNHKKHYAITKLRILTFNNKRRQDCADWANHQVHTFGTDEIIMHKNCKFKLEKEEQLINNYNNFWGLTK